MVNINAWKYGALTRSEKDLSLFPLLQKKNKQQSLSCLQGLQTVLFNI